MLVKDPEKRIKSKDLHGMLSVLLYIFIFIIIILIDTILFL